MTTNTNTAEDRANIDAIAAVLLTHGAGYHGGVPMDMARGWDGYGFTDHGVDQWCEAGVWEPSVAEYLYEAGVKPRHLQAIADEMTATGDYTDGCPIYAACNGDIHPRRIVEFWRAM